LPPLLLLLMLLSSSTPLLPPLPPLPVEVDVEVDFGCVTSVPSRSKQKRMRRCTNGAVPWLLIGRIVDGSNCWLVECFVLIIGLFCFALSVCLFVFVCYICEWRSCPFFRDTPSFITPPFLS
jgi:hypothetical protein